MKMGADGRIILSRRNLLALLQKLDMPGSYRTIIAPESEGEFVVSAETDEEHYQGRTPGVMHPLTEEFIRKAR